MFNYKLIDIFQDDSTGFDLKRPGLWAALEQMERTNAVFISIALDRLSRNLIDTEYILDTYFGEGRPHQLFLMDCAGIDAKNCDGRMMLRFKALMAQHQVETIRDRTQQGVRYAMQQGVAVGRMSYGRAYSRQLDANGRRIVVDVPEQLATIARMRELHVQGLRPSAIAKQLQAEDRPTAGGARWQPNFVRKVLQREGLLAVKSLDRSGHVNDQEKSIERIKLLRARGFSLREIGRLLLADKLAPPRGKKWYAQTIADLIRKNTVPDRTKAIKFAVSLRQRGMSLRKIGEQLLVNNITPPRGGYWHAEQVRKLLTDAQLFKMANVLTGITRGLDGSTESPQSEPKVS
jgi:DNA invertase Pin-like site-specific DNA recombinase